MTDRPPVIVACVWVKGHVHYPDVYVERLASMVRRHLSRPHSICCLTDRPDRVPSGVTAVTIASPGKLHGWWSKIELFNPARAWGGRRVLYLDLDTLIVAALDPIVDFAAPFALVPHAGDFHGKNGLSVVPRFNSSVMVWTAGAADDVFTTWTPAIAKRLHGDQDHIGEVASDAVAMPLEWFPRLSSIGVAGQLPTGARVVLAKKPKNIEAAQRWPWFAERWS